MKDLKSIIALNIAELRRRDGMTQLELAEKLNYSDKAISKWERGESVPDVTVLKNIADMFGVTVDYLLEEEHAEEPENVGSLPIECVDEAILDKRRKNRDKAHKSIQWMSVMLVWLVAVTAFVLLVIFTDFQRYSFLPVILAVPISCVVGLVLNSVWFSGKNNLWIITCLMWSAIASIHLSLHAVGITDRYISLIYLLGIPGQIIIVLWAICIKRRRAAKGN